jgi:CBS domain-containing protein
MENRMKVATVLKNKGRRIVTVHPESTIDAIVHRLKLERIGAVIVSTDGNTVAGILSERDIVRALAKNGAEALELKAKDLMTREVVTCRPEDTVQSVMIKMSHQRVRHLPVLDNGRLVGVISIGDVVKNRLEEVELEANVLRDAYLAAH